MSRTRALWPTRIKQAICEGQMGDSKELSILWHLELPVCDEHASGPFAVFFKLKLL